MKTVFKVGMEVYDQVNFPNKKGRVVDVEPSLDEDDYPIEVEFEDNYCSSCYTFDGRLDLEEIPTLSTKPYKVELQGFEQKALIPAFEEALEWLDNNENYQTVFEDERTYPSKEIYNAFEALRKLTILRDYYNNGLKQEDLGNVINAIVIERVDDEYQFVVRKNFNTRHILFFKSEEIAESFLREQKELLEIAKPLL